MKYAHQVCPLRRGRSVEFCPLEAETTVAGSEEGQGEETLRAGATHPTQRRDRQVPSGRCEYC